MDKQLLRECRKIVDVKLNEIDNTFNVKSDSKEELAKSQAFLAYSFGFGPRKDGKIETRNGREIHFKPEEFFVGISNEGLAKVISDYRKQGLNIPVFAQWEIAVALAEKYGLELPEKQIAKPREGYLGTPGVIQQFLEGGVSGLERVAVVAHPDHMRRAVDTTAGIVKAKRGKGFEAVYETDTSSVGYDSLSVQPWTRSEKAFSYYEFFNRAAFELTNMFQQATRD